MYLSGNQQLIRHVNRTAILREIRKRPGLSRTDLAGLTGLTRAGIGRLVDGLVVDGWLAEDATLAIASSGRRPMPLVFDAYRLVLLGAQLDREHSRLIATTLAGDIFDFSVEKLVTTRGEAAVAVLAEQVVELMRRLDASGRRVCGIGVALPGPVSNEGVLRFSESTGWSELPAAALLSAAIQRVGLGVVPVVVDRSVNCVALCHAERSRLDDTDALLYVHAGQGVAVAALQGDAVIRGANGFAGYVAHQSLMPGGPLCSCGRRGCVQAVLSFEALRPALGAMRHLPSAQLAPALNQALARGDQHVIEDIDRLAERLGQFVFNLSQTYDPARIFLGGAAFGLAHHISGRVLETFAALHADIGGVAPPLRVMQVDHQTAAQGAAVLALRSLLKPGLVPQQRAAVSA